MIQITPCKDCTDRYIGCHSECMRWHQWKTADTERKNLIDRAKKTDNDFRSARYAKSVRYQRRICNRIASGKPIW